MFDFGMVLDVKINACVIYLHMRKEDGRGPLIMRRSSPSRKRYWKIMGRIWDKPGQKI